MEPDHSFFPRRVPICSSVLRALGHPLPALLGHPPGLRSWPLWEQGGNRWQRMTGEHILDVAACSGALVKPCSEMGPPASQPAFLWWADVVPPPPPFFHRDCHPDKWGPGLGSSIAYREHVSGLGGGGI